MDEEEARRVVRRIKSVGTLDLLLARTVLESSGRRGNRRDSQLAAYATEQLYRKRGV